MSVARTGANCTQLSLADLRGPRFTRLEVCSRRRFSGGFSILSSTTRSRSWQTIHRVRANSSSQQSMLCRTGCEETRTGSRYQSRPLARSGSGSRKYCRAIEVNAGNEEDDQSATAAPETRERMMPNAEPIIIERIRARSATRFGGRGRQYYIPDFTSGVIGRAPTTPDGRGSLLTFWSRDHREG
jgi:hypothetical protein